MRWLRLTKVCLSCGKFFNTNSKTSLCCCRKCYKEVKDNYDKKYVKYCRKCGNKLTYNQLICGLKYCSRKCGWTNDEVIENKRITLKKRWECDNFRNQVVERMKLKNPSYDRKNIYKSLRTKEERGNAHTWKGSHGGNGTISEAEQELMKFCSDLGFEYNKAISTYKLRVMYPEKHYAFNYKPDFVNLEYKLCIEVDGNSHQTILGKQRDRKKEECLEMIGFTTIRFSNKDVLNNFEYVKKSILDCLEELKSGTPDT